MKVASLDKSPWVIGAADQTPTLEIVQLRQALILSWNQFVYAEGGDDEVRIAFASHDVVVTGAGLGPLLPAIAAHRVALIRQASRSERFADSEGPFVGEIVVRKMEVE
jgi:hypothetical protein